jgi:peroxiredoxin
VLAEPDFSLSTAVGESIESMNVENSRENEAFKAFQKRMGALQTQQRNLEAILDSLTGPDSIAVRSQMVDVSEKMKSFQDSVISGNSDLYFADFVRLIKGKDVPDFDEIGDEKERREQRYLYLKNNYFDGISLNRMMRTPVIHSYVMRYFDDLIVPAPDSVIKAIDLVLTDLATEPPAFRYWLVSLFNKYQESNLMGMDAVTAHLVENYYLSDRVDWLPEESRQNMMKELRYIKPNLIGKQAPAFKAQDLQGNDWSLADASADYLVLYFYDPDCGVCKKKTPILKENYDEIRSLGGEVVAVSTITDRQKWENYVTENDLPWINLADLNYKSNFRVDYNVRSTPQVYVLDKDRKIVAKKLDVDQVAGFIRDHQEISAE